jgi:hypothetical protein
MVGKNGIFRGKSFEKSFSQEIPRKKCTKNRPQVSWSVDKMFLDELMWHQRLALCLSLANSGGKPQLSNYVPFGRRQKRCILCNRQFDLEVGRAQV